MLVLLVLQHAGLVYSQPAAAIVARPDWLGRFLATPLGVAEAFKYGVLLVYLEPNSTGHIVPFLWTMTAEMLGSIFVFALLGCWAGLRRRELLLAALILLCEATWATAFLSCFACGLLFGAWRTRGVFAQWAAAPWRRALALALILVVLLAVDHAPLDDARLQSAAAMLLLGAIHASPAATRAFRSGPSRLLGKLSFPLYLVQFPVIVSLTSWLIVRAGTGLTAGAALGIAVVSLATALVAAAAFEPVEILTKRVGHLLAQAFVAPRGG